MADGVKQSGNADPIVQTSGTILLVGGANISQVQLKKYLSFTDQYVAADGGADLLLQAGVKPTAVIGDLDSISDAVRHDFAAILHPVMDQSLTDFEKTLRAVQADVILGVGFLGGRLDHTLSTLNVLIRHAEKPVILVGEDDIAFVVQGRVTLPLAAGTPLALLPLNPVQVTTTGLVWDLDGQVLAPDGLVSSSNMVQAGPVQIDSDGPVIVTLPLSHLKTATDAVRAG